eukprot:scaffold14880_cov90-Skeletonema_marinoi.AAC.4
MNSFFLLAQTRSSMITTTCSKVLTEIMHGLAWPNVTRTRPQDIEVQILLPQCPRQTTKHLNSMRRSSAYVQLQAQHEMCESDTLVERRREPGKATQVGGKGDEA